MTCIAVERFQGILYPLHVRNNYVLHSSVRMLGEERRDMLLMGCLFFYGATLLEILATLLETPTSLQIQPTLLEMLDTLLGVSANLL